MTRTAPLPLSPSVAAFLDRPRTAVRLKIGRLGLLCALWIGLSACGEKSKPKIDTVPEPTPSSSAAPAAEPKPRSYEGHSPYSKGNPLTIGPELIVQPGQGLSAIRFGATVETLARHMEAPCELQTEARCVYVQQAVEFGLTNGVVSSMKAHRRDRVVADVESGKKLYYGSFHGKLLPSTLLGMHKHIVFEEYGQPRTIEKVDPPGPNGLEERHTYDGLVIEYDRLENQNVVAGAFEVVSTKAAEPQ